MNNTLALQIKQNLTFNLNTLWSDRSRGMPHWVQDVITEASLQRVLLLAQETTVELGVPAENLSETAPAELATYWVLSFQDLYDQELPRDPVKPEMVEYTIARRVAAAVYAMHLQSTRYRNFLRFGPPPGVRQFPEFTGSERSKTLAIPWEWRRTAAQAERSLLYRSCLASKPRRVQSLRSTQCTESDVLFPSMFT
jgi:hypothetical protein